MLQWIIVKGLEDLFDVLKRDFIFADESHAGFHCRVNVCVAFAQRAHIDFLHPGVVEEDQIEIFLFFQIVFDGEIIAFFRLLSKTEHIFSIDFFQNFLFDILKITFLRTDQIKIF